MGAAAVAETADTPPYKGERTTEHATDVTACAQVKRQRVSRPALSGEVLIRVQADIAILAPAPWFPRSIPLGYNRQRGPSLSRPPP